jgi:hypothetical protein
MTMLALPVEDLYVFENVFFLDDADLEGGRRKRVRMFT